MILFMSIVLSACEILGSDGGDEPVTTTTVLVANGGNFGDQNGSLTTFDPVSGIVDQQSPMSGFLQGIAADGDNIYALLNTFSVGRVDVLESSTLAPVDQINDVAAPRFMAFGADEAYVSNFVFGSAGHVSVISRMSNTVEKTIQVGENPEGVVLSGTSLFVANNGSLGAGNSVSVVDTNTDNVITRTVPCDGPRDIFNDDTAGLIVICSGKTVYSADFSEILEQTNGAILFFDSDLDMLENRIDLSFQPLSTNGTAAGTFVPSQAELYVIDGTANSVTRVDTNSRLVTSQVQLSTSGGLTGISGIAYDEAQDNIYIGRFPVSSAGPFPDFTASGTVEIYTRTFELTDSFLAGISISQIRIQN
jgi:hypothetical protein